MLDRSLILYAINLDENDSIELIIMKLLQAFARAFPSSDGYRSQLIVCSEVNRG